MEFPPFNSAGSYRPFHFAKNLLTFGVKTTVLSIDLKDTTRANNAKMLEELPKEIKIIRLKYQDRPRLNDLNSFWYKITHYFKADDLWSSMIKNEVKSNLKNIILSNKIDIALITIPPFSSPRLFIPLLKKYDIPLIIDMRDHYSLWRATPYATYFHFLRVHWIEKYYLKKASKVIVVSNQMKIDLLKSHPSISNLKIDVIPNGIDKPIEEKVISSKSIETSTDKYIIGYSGSFYYNPDGQIEIMKSWKERKGLKKLYYNHRIEDWKYRSPYYFFKVLKKLFDLYPHLKSKIEFHFAGDETEWLINQVNEFGLEKNYKYVGYLSKDEITDFHKTCDAYLITSVKVLNGKDYCIASKTFSYLEGGKPILGFVTEGEQQEMLKTTGMGVIFDADEIELNVNKLYHFLKEPQKFTYNTLINKTYTRLNQAEALSTIISNLVH